MYNRIVDLQGTKKTENRIAENVLRIILKH